MTADGPIFDASQLGDEDWGDLLEWQLGDEPPPTQYGVLCAYHEGFNRRVSTIGLVAVTVMPVFEFTYGAFVESSELGRFQFGAGVYPVLSVMPA